MQERRPLQRGPLRIIPLRAAASAEDALDRLRVVPHLAHDRKAGRKREDVAARRKQPGDAWI